MQETNLSVRVTGVVQPCAGVNLRLVLPLGLELGNVEKGPILPSSFVIQSLARVVSGSREIAIVAQSASETFTADGELCRIPVKVPEDMPPGLYPMAFVNAPSSEPVRSSQALSDTSAGPSLLPGTIDGVLTVRLSGVPGDSKGNGIPDAWEIAHFGAVTNVSHTTDFDLDGLSDYHEYLGSTDPRDSDSRLAIVDFDAQSSETATVLKWYSVPGALYRVSRSDGLSTQTAFERIVDRIPATPPLNVHTDKTAVGKKRVYYQVGEGR